MVVQNYLNIARHKQSLSTLAVSIAILDDKISILHGAGDVQPSQAKPAKPAKPSQPNPT
jgi:hypothetical protein